MDFSIWCTLHYRYWLRTSIWIAALDQPNVTPRFQTLPDYLLSSTNQRHGWTFSPTTESRSQLNPNAWMDSLPLLLGIHTSQRILTLLQKRWSVTLPSVCLVNSLPRPLPPRCLIPPSEYLNQLKAHFRTLSATSPRLTQWNSTIASGLATATHVLVRHDAVRNPLQPPYNGPFPVVERTNKHFTVALNGRNDTISIDRLKPAHLDSEHSDTHTEQSPPTPPTPTSPSTASPSHVPISTISPRTTRSGRRVHFPTFLSRNVQDTEGSHVVNTLTLT